MDFTLRRTNSSIHVLYTFVSMFSAHRNSSSRYKAPVDDSCEESSIFSSDLETTSVADSEDDRRSRFVIDCFVIQGHKLY
jgi:hypothetical protein